MNELIWVNTYNNTVVLQRHYLKWYTGNTAGCLIFYDFIFYHNFCVLGQAVTYGIFSTILFKLVDMLVHISSFSSVKNLCVYYFIEVCTWVCLGIWWLIDRPFCGLTLLYLLGELPAYTVSIHFYWNWQIVC